MSRRRSRYLFIVVAIGTVILSQTAASAADPPPSADVLSRISAAELADLQHIADELGMSLEQAVDDIGWQNEFALLATDLEERYPDRFAGAEIVDAAGRIASIAFTGEVPAEAVTRASGFGLAEVRLIGGRAHSVRDLDERLVAAHTATVARSAPGHDVVSSYDPITGALTVVTGPGMASGEQGDAGPWTRSSSLERALGALAQR